MASYGERAVGINFNPSGETPRLWPDLPPLITRAGRDEQYISKLADAVDAFNEELDAVVERIRKLQEFVAL